MPRKPACQRKRRPPLVFVWISGWLFHLRAPGIGQEREVSLLRAFAELLQLHFYRQSAACLWSHFSCEIATLKQELNY